MDEVNHLGEAKRVLGRGDSQECLRSSRGHCLESLQKESAMNEPGISALIAKLRQRIKDKRYCATTYPGQAKPAAVSISIKDLEAILDKLEEVRHE